MFSIATMLVISIMMLTVIIVIIDSRTALDGYLDRIEPGFEIDRTRQVGNSLIQIFFGNIQKAIDRHYIPVCIMYLK